MKLLKFVFIFSLVFEGCTNPIAPTESLTYKIKLGAIATFQVLAETTSVGGGTITTSYWIKEHVVDEEVSENETLFTVEQLRKGKETDNWKISSVYKVSQSPDKIIRFENSIPIVSLTFPVSNQNEWNKNVYNTDPKVNLKYENIGEKLGEVSPTYKVTEVNDSTLIDLKRAYEVYSPTKGLLVRERTFLNYCQSSPDCIGKGEVAYGSRIIWKRVD